MSRHEIASPDSTNPLEVVVGWDPPLGTFFAQVWDRSLDEDDPDAELLWIGCTPGEITDPRQVLNAVGAWVTVPPDLVHTLNAEAHA
ncbi:MAG: hypothetical protein ABW022_07210 [Actinoplanes sp.]